MSKTPIPILVGVGQRTIRTRTLDDFVHPVEAMKYAVERAAEDAGSRGLIDKADALHVVNILSWKLTDPPVQLAEALGAHPTLKEYTTVGGNTPQWLVNRVADNLVAGKSEIAILAGCEVMRSVSIAMAQGKDLGFFKEETKVAMVGEGRPGINDVERMHQADRPIRVYPILENALRAKCGWTLDQQRESLGKFGEAYSAVAAQNENAWFPIERTAEEIVTPTERNRYISWPYTKYLNAIMAVDQAAAVIMTTTEVAARLGIPKEKWVYLHGRQDAHDAWFVSDRPDLADSPAIAATGGDALAQAGITIDDVAFFDFYSCFPVMPRITRRALGIAEDDPRPMTIIGGLPYFGGAGNNYVMHAIAEAVELCRADRSVYGMVTSNGWYCTKHGVGIYSGREPERTMERTPSKQFQEELVLPPDVELDPNPTGDFTVEGYTVWHTREGGPDVGILCGRTAAGKRAWAQTARDDLELMQAMMNEEWVGKTGGIVSQEKGINLIRFD